jgi:hypothetical protein
MVFDKLKTKKSRMAFSWHPCLKASNTGFLIPYTSAGWVGLTTCYMHKG